MLNTNGDGANNGNNEDETEGEILEEMQALMKIKCVL